jgi:hypothetical protein
MHEQGIYAVELASCVQAGCQLQGAAAGPVYLTLLGWPS